MSSRKVFVLVFAVVYTAITGAYSASKWIDPSVAHEKLHLILFALVVLTALVAVYLICLLYTSPSPRDRTRSRMPSSA